MTRSPRILVAALAAAGLLAMAAWAPPACAGLIFSDDFSTSTLNSATPAAPTATSTNYEVLSTKDATGSSIATNSLNLAMVNTSSGFAEVESLFAPLPVALTQTGDYVKATLVFTPTGLNLAGNSTVNIGLYNSGGAGPVPGANLNNGQLDDAGIYTTGNAAGWLGYVGRIGRPGGASSQIFTRPAQVGETTAEAQDGLFNNAGGGAFDNPSGTTIQGGGTGALLTNGTEYTLELLVTYDAGTGFVSVSYDLSDENGSITSVSGVTDGSTTIATAFDAIAFGYRGTDSQGPYSLNASSLTVESNVVIIPEPASLGLLVAGGLVVLGLRRRRSCS